MLLVLVWERGSLLQLQVRDARADSLRAGLQPVAWRSGIGVTRCAPAEERAHTVLRALSQNSTSVLESMNAASTTHLLL